MITAVILNWKRADNVVRIVDGWRAGGIVTEAIVWNNNPAERFRHNWAKVINAEQDMGLYTRFAAACLAGHECILIQDDDLELPEDSLRSLCEAWRQDPDVLHGLFGRRPNAEGRYDPRNVVSGDVPVVLTRALVASRRYAADFFDVARQFEVIQREGKPAGNGEDILFSYTAMRYSGRLNCVHRLPVTELPAPDSIHSRNWSAHLAHRSRLICACEVWLKRERQEHHRDLLHS
jgi:hypothetical protein